MLWNKVKAVLMFSVRIFACFSFSKSFEKHFVKLGITPMALMTTAAI